MKKRVLKKRSLKNKKEIIINQSFLSKLLVILVILLMILTIIYIIIYNPQLTQAISKGAGELGTLCI